MALKSHKLSPRFIGPYQIIKRDDEVAYQIALLLIPANLHDTFHDNLSYEVRPLKVEDQRVKQLRGKEILLVKSPRPSQSDSVASIQNRVSSTPLHPSLCLDETVSDSSLPRPNRTSLSRERVRILHLTNFTTDESNLFEHQEAGSMENNDRTLKELATLDVVYQPWCIQCPPLEPAQSYELKSSLIQLLPKFHDLAGEDPHKHLKEFHVVCSTMRPQGISKDHIKMKATTTIRKEIYGIKKHSSETLHEYWERFNKLCATCPHHQISEQLLIQYFYEGLMMMDRSMIDAASGGALMDKSRQQHDI
ncbi:hypothetical protein CR513_07308, partial [Mucuna pruriens]